jgi:hypothetical protein
MLAEPLESLFRQLLEDLLSVNLEEAPELESETREWIAAQPGSTEVESLFHWSEEVEAPIAPYLELAVELALEPDWGHGRQFIDAYGGGHLSSAAVLALLNWMRNLPSHRELLAERPVITEPLGAKVSKIRLNDVIVKDPNYVWFWKNYLSALADGPFQSEVLPFVEDLRYVVWRSGELSELGYELGRLVGRLEERRESGSSLGSAVQAVLDEVRAGNLAAERRDRAAYEMQLAQSERLNRISEGWQALETLVLDAASEIEKAGAVASFEVQTAAADRLQASVDRLTAGWRETHSVRELEQAASVAANAVGLPAWPRLDERSRDALSVQSVIAEEYPEIATLLLLVTLEREVGCALARCGLGRQEISPTYERKVEQAKGSPHARLASLGDELSQAGLHRVRNAVAHGAGVSRDTALRVKSELLTDNQGKKGFIGRLASLGWNSTGL